MHEMLHSSGQAVRLRSGMEVLRRGGPKGEQPDEVLPPVERPSQPEPGERDLVRAEAKAVAVAEPNGQFRGGLRRERHGGEGHSKVSIVVVDAVQGSGVVRDLRRAGPQRGAARVLALPLGGGQGALQEVRRRAHHARGEPGGRDRSERVHLLPEQRRDPQLQGDLDHVRSEVGGVDQGVQGV